VSCFLDLSSGQRSVGAVVREYGRESGPLPAPTGLNDEDAADVFQTTLLTWPSTWRKSTSQSGSQRGSSPQPSTSACGSSSCGSLFAQVAPRGRSWPPEERVILEARDKGTLGRLHKLSARSSAVVEVVRLFPDYTYVDLGRPWGSATDSIGQTKGRCLKLLRLRLGEVR